jgi:hypothetical protein
MGDWALELQMHAGFILLSRQQHHGTASRSPCGNWAPKLQLPTGSVLLSVQQSHRTVRPEACVENHAMEHPLPPGSVLLSRQPLQDTKFPEVVWEIGPQNFHCLLAPEWASVPQNWTPWDPCGKSGPGMRAACKLCSFKLAVAAMAPGSLCLNASRPQGHHWLLGTRWFKLTGLAAWWVPSTCYTVLGAYQHTSKWTPGSGLC